MSSWHDARRASTLEIVTQPVIRVKSRDDVRRLSTLDVPLDYRRRDSSREDSRASSDASRGALARGGRFVVPDGSRQASRSRSCSSRPTDDTASFQYDALDSNVKRAIRTVRIKSSLVNGLIAAEIEEMTTEADYSCVSYTWGLPKDDLRTILINGQRFRVRQNLFEFLSHARDYHAGERLWIDAICINQGDNDEKSRQVQMMSKIYYRAREVLVWLGPRMEYVGHCMRRMKDFENMGDTKMALESSNDSDFWKGFKAINSAPYWDRVWVIQEFVTPRDGRIIQGNRSVSFKTFQSTITRFNNSIYRLMLKNWVFGPRGNETFNGYISKIHPLWEKRIERQRTGAHNTDAEWAKLSGSRFCTNVRDRIYGILPLATHGNDLRVDYDLNPFELLLESIWLEHDTEMDRTELLMNLANILMLTPASICMYAAHRTSSYGRKNMRVPQEVAAKYHLRSASARSAENEWLDVSWDGRKALEWRNFARDGSLRVPKGKMVFPSRNQCPWQMMTHTVVERGDKVANVIGLKIAVDARDMPAEKKGRDRDRDGDRDRDRRRRDDKKDSYGYMSEDDFVELNRKPALALGVYETKCAPYPMRIFYSLVDHLESAPKNDDGLFTALDGLDLDI